MPLNSFTVLLTNTQSSGIQELAANLINIMGGGKPMGHTIYTDIHTLEAASDANSLESLDLRSSIESIGKLPQNEWPAWYSEYKAQNVRSVRDLLGLRDIKLVDVKSVFRELAKPAAQGVFPTEGRQFKFATVGDQLHGGTLDRAYDDWLARDVRPPEYTGLLNDLAVFKIVTMGQGNAQLHTSIGIAFGNVPQEGAALDAWLARNIDPAWKLSASYTANHPEDGNKRVIINQDVLREMSYSGVDTNNRQIKIDTRVLLARPESQVIDSTLRTFYLRTYKDVGVTDRLSRRKFQFIDMYSDSPEDRTTLVEISGQDMAFVLGRPPSYELRFEGTLFDLKKQFRAMESMKVMGIYLADIAKTANEQGGRYRYGNEPAKLKQDAFIVSKKIQRAEAELTCKIYGDQIDGRSRLSLMAFRGNIEAQFPTHPDFYNQNLPIRTDLLNQYMDDATYRLSVLNELNAMEPVALSSTLSTYFRDPLSVLQELSSIGSGATLEHAIEICSRTDARSPAAKLSDLPISGEPLAAALVLRSSRKGYLAKFNTPYSTRFVARTLPIELSALGIRGETILDPASGLSAREILYAPVEFSQGELSAAERRRHLGWLEFDGNAAAGVPEDVISPYTTVSAISDNDGQSSYRSASAEVAVFDQAPASLSKPTGLVRHLGYQSSSELDALLGQLSASGTEPIADIPVDVVPPQVVIPPLPNDADQVNIPGAGDGLGQPEPVDPIADIPVDVVPPQVVIPPLPNDADQVNIPGAGDDLGQAVGGNAAPDEHEDLAPDGAAEEEPLPVAEASDRSSRRNPFRAIANACSNALGKIKSKRTRRSVDTCIDEEPLDEVVMEERVDEVLRSSESLRTEVSIPYATRLSIVTSEGLNIAMTLRAAISASFNDNDQAGAESMAILVAGLWEQQLAGMAADVAQVRITALLENTESATLRCIISRTTELSFGALSLAPVVLSLVFDGIELAHGGGVKAAVHLGVDSAMLIGGLALPMMGLGELGAAGFVVLTVGEMIFDTVYEIKEFQDTLGHLAGSEYWSVIGNALIGLPIPSAMDARVARFKFTQQKILESTKLLKPNGHYAAVAISLGSMRYTEGGSYTGSIYSPREGGYSSRVLTQSCETQNYQRKNTEPSDEKISLARVSPLPHDWVDQSYYGRYMFKIVIDGLAIPYCLDPNLDDAYHYSQFTPGIRPPRACAAGPDPCNNRIEGECRSVTGLSTGETRTFISPKVTNFPGDTDVSHCANSFIMLSGSLLPTNETDTARVIAIASNPRPPEDCGSYTLLDGYGGNDNVLINWPTAVDFFVKPGNISVVSSSYCPVRYYLADYTATYGRISVTGLADNSIIVANLKIRRYGVISSLPPARIDLRSGTLSRLHGGSAGLSFGALSGVTTDIPGSLVIVGRNAVTVSLNAGLGSPIALEIHTDRNARAQASIVGNGSVTVKGRHGSVAVVATIIPGSTISMNTVYSMEEDLFLALASCTVELRLSSSGSYLSNIRSVVTQYSAAGIPNTRIVFTNPRASVSTFILDGLCNIIVDQWSWTIVDRKLDQNSPFSRSIANFPQHMALTWAGPAKNCQVASLYVTETLNLLMQKNITGSAYMPAMYGDVSAHNATHGCGVVMGSNAPNYVYYFPNEDHDKDGRPDSPRAERVVMLNREGIIAANPGDNIRIKAQEGASIMVKFIACTDSTAVRVLFAGVDDNRTAPDLLIVANAVEPVTKLPINTAVVIERYSSTMKILLNGKPFPNGWGQIDFESTLILPARGVHILMLSRRLPVVDAISASDAGYTDIDCSIVDPIEHDICKDGVHILIRDRVLSGRSNPSLCKIANFINEPYRSVPGIYIGGAVKFGYQIMLAPVCSEQTKQLWRGLPLVSHTISCGMRGVIPTSSDWYVEHRSIDLSKIIRNDTIFSADIRSYGAEELMGLAFNSSDCNGLIAFRTDRETFSLRLGPNNSITVPPIYSLSIPGSFVGNNFTNDTSVMNSNNTIATGTAVDNFYSFFREYDASIHANLLAFLDALGRGARSELANGYDSQPTTATRVRVFDRIAPVCVVPPGESSALRFVRANCKQIRSKRESLEHCHEPNYPYDILYLTDANQKPKLVSVIKNLRGSGIELLAVSPQGECTAEISALFAGRRCGKSRVNIKQFSFFYTMSQFMSGNIGTLHVKRSYGTFTPCRRENDIELRQELTGRIHVLQGAAEPGACDLRIRNGQINIQAHSVTNLCRSARHADYDHDIARSSSSRTGGIIQDALNHLGFIYLFSAYPSVLNPGILSRDAAYAGQDNFDKSLTPVRHDDVIKHLINDRSPVRASVQSNPSDTEAVEGQWIVSSINEVRQLKETVCSGLPGTSCRVSLSNAIASSTMELSSNHFADKVGMLQSVIPIKVPVRDGSLMNFAHASDWSHDGTTVNVKRAMMQACAKVPSDLHGIKVTHILSPDGISSSRSSMVMGNDAAKVCSTLVDAAVSINHPTYKILIDFGNDDGIVAAMETEPLTRPAYQNQNAWAVATDATQLLDLALAHRRIRQDWRANAAKAIEQLRSQSASILIDSNAEAILLGYKTQSNSTINKIISFIIGPAMGQSADFATPRERNIIIEKMRAIGYSTHDSTWIFDKFVGLMLDNYVIGRSDTLAGPATKNHIWPNVVVANGVVNRYKSLPIMHSYLSLRIEQISDLLSLGAYKQVYQLCSQGLRSAIHDLSDMVTVVTQCINEFECDSAEPWVWDSLANYIDHLARFDRVAKQELNELCKNKNITGLREKLSSLLKIEKRNLFLAERALRDVQNGTDHGLNLALYAHNQDEATLISQEAFVRLIVLSKDLSGYDGDFPEHQLAAALTVGYLAPSFDIIACLESLGIHINSKQQHLLRDFIACHSSELGSWIGRVNHPAYRDTNVIDPRVLSSQVSAYQERARHFKARQISELGAQPLPVSHLLTDWVANFWLLNDAESARELQNMRISLHEIESNAQYSDVDRLQLFSSVLRQYAQYCSEDMLSLLTESLQGNSSNTEGFLSTLFFMSGKSCNDYQLEVHGQISGKLSYVSVDTVDNLLKSSGIEIAFARRDYFGVMASHMSVLICLQCNLELQESTVSALSSCLGGYLKGDNDIERTTDNLLSLIGESLPEILSGPVSLCDCIDPMLGSPHQYWKAASKVDALIHSLHNSSNAKVEHNEDLEPSSAPGVFLSATQAVRSEAVQCCIS